jgi:hypothetical protein
MPAMRRLGVSAACIVAALLAAERAFAQPLRVEAQGETAAMERALGQSVARVSRPAQPFALGFDDVRAFRLEGYGIVFVLSPRHLPGGSGGRGGFVHRFRFQGEPSADLAQSREVLQDAIKSAPSEEVKDQIRSSLAALDRLQKGPVPAGALAPAAEAEARTRSELKRLREDIELFRSQSEQEWARAERSLTEALAAANRQQDPAPPQPAPPSLVEIPEPVFPPAPWAVWFEIEENGETSPDEAVRGVRTAVTRVLEAAPPIPQGLRPDEFVAVAVDFLPREAFIREPKARKTLVIRVRKRDLDERRAGQISAESLRSRIEVIER